MFPIFYRVWRELKKNQLVLQFEGQLTQGDTQRSHDIASGITCLLDFLVEIFLTPFLK